MTCLTLKYVTGVMVSVSLVCAIVLGALIKAVGGNRLKRFSHSNNSGKEVFTLNMLGSVVFLVVQAFIFAVSIHMGLGKEIFA